MFLTLAVYLSQCGNFKRLEEMHEHCSGIQFQKSLKLMAVFLSSYSLFNIK